MISSPTFDAILESIAQLPPDEQEDLVDVVRRRLAALRREQLIAEVRQAETEAREAGIKPGSTDDVMRDIVS